MKNRSAIWSGIVLVLVTFISACGADSTTPEAPTASLAQPTPAENVVAEEESVSEVSVTLNSTVHSSDLGGYAWLQEFLSSNDADAADTRSWSESARAGAVCYASIAPTIKSAPSAVDGSFSITFEAEPGSTFRLMCDPDETHPGALGIDVFTVPDGGGTIDHATAGFFSPGLWTPELGVTNEVAARAAGYADAETMFQSAGTCRVFALPGVSSTIAVSDGDAYGFYMEAPDTAGRVTILDNPSRAGAYVVVKEFEADESEAVIDIDLKDTSGSGMTWPTATCPIMRGFSTDLVVVPNDVLASVPEETVSSLSPVTTPDGNQVGESELERATDKILMNFQACCVTPGNAYTAWWVIGDVTRSMGASRTLHAAGWVAESEEVMLALELEAGVDGIRDTLDGVRIAVLDHGSETGDADQLTTPGGGCPGHSMCPLVLSTSHASPQ